MIADGGVTAVGKWARASIADARGIIRILTKIPRRDPANEHKSFNLSETRKKNSWI